MTKDPAENRHDAQMLIQEADELQQLITSGLIRRYQEYFGHPMEFLITNCGVVRAFADHPDSEYRSLALSFLARYGESAESTKALLTRKAREDPSMAVRRCAISILAQLGHATRDVDISYLLKAIVYDEREDASVRKVAYFGITYFDRHGNLMNVESFRFPEEIDWEYLDQLLPEE